MNKQTNALNVNVPDHQALASQDWFINHHGAVTGVTGSCHELSYTLNHDRTGVLIDCGLFQGAETQEHSETPHSSNQDSLLDDTIPFDISHIKALVVTHVHIDHVGRIPYLLAKGFTGPIYCSEASAKLLPLVLEDAIKIGFTRNHRYIQKFIKHIKALIQPLAFNKWQVIDKRLTLKLKPAGHILGSAYVLCKLTPAKLGLEPAGREKHLTPVGRRWRGSAKIKTKTIIFSGDLGAPHSPILKAPKPPIGCDVLVMESTYGDKNHENRRDRKQRFKALIEKALSNNGTLVIPAFSIGRTQELLYELEEIIHQETAHTPQKTVGASLLAKNPKAVLYEPAPAGELSQTTEFYKSPSAVELANQAELYKATPGADKTNKRAAPSNNPETQKVDWQNLEVILDSPLAAKFTHAIGQLKHCWDKESQQKIKRGRKPLSFENITTINTHKEHLQTVEYLANNKRPAIVIAASGMCNGGRVMNYLKAMLGDARHDVLFVGYQASGTMGRLIQKHGPSGGYVTIDGKKITIKAGIYTMGGYSAHAGQTDLLNFVKRMWGKPSEIRLIHGDDRAKQNLQAKLQASYAKANVWIPIE